MSRDDSHMRPQHRPASDATGNGGLAHLIRLVSLVAIALGLFAIVTGGVAIYLNLTAQLELERAGRVAGRQADRITDALSKIQTSLRDASVVDAARSGPAGGNDALRRALGERGVVNIIDVRVLPARIEALATDNGAALDFDVSEVVMEAIRRDRAEIRVLSPGTPVESLTFAQRMPGEEGILLLRLTSSVATSLVRIEETLDFVALVQGSPRDATVLHSGGRAPGGNVRQVPIDGSDLTLQWHRAVVSVPLDNRSAVILGCSGIIVLMIGLLLRRRTRLAYLLGHKSRPQLADSTERQASITPQPPSPGPHRPGAESTLVLNPDEDDRAEPSSHTAPDGGQGDDVEEDEPPTVLSPPPDLPAWLRDDDDHGGQS